MAIFQRQSFKERGHFSNLPSLFPIKKLKIESKGITIERRFLGQVYYPWAVLNVEVLKRNNYKGYGGDAFAKFTQKVCSIYANGKRFSFDMSDNFPDFSHRDTKEILTALSCYCKIKEISQIKQTWKDWWSNYDRF